MKKKIKTWLIHFLGGVTEKEIHQSNLNSAYFGAYQALTIIKEYADSLNGKSADEWRELVYKQIFGGKYNTDTLQVEKSTCSFRPFDKVLVRDNEGQIWNANYFSYYRENNKDFLYACMDNPYRFCIPYEGNEHLLGTTDPYTEGDSK